MNQLRWICSRLREIRLLHNWTLNEVASRAGVKISRISETESCKWDVRFQTLCVHALALGWEIPNVLDCIPKSNGYLPIMTQPETRRALRELHFNKKQTEEILDFTKAPLLGHFVTRQLSNIRHDNKLRGVCRDHIAYCASLKTLVNGTVVRTVRCDEYGYLVETEYTHKTLKPVT